MLKILYDGEQFSKQVNGRSGIFRVASEYLKRLACRDNVKVTLLVSEKVENVRRYLQENALEDKTEILFIPNLHKTSKLNNPFFRLRSAWLTNFLAFKHKKHIQEFDFFFSPYISVPPLVYKSGIKTAVIVHDLIPIMRPDFYEAGASFPRKYAGQIKAIKSDMVFFDSLSAQKDFLNFRPDFKKEKTILVSCGADKMFAPVAEEDVIGSVREKYKIPTQKYVLGLADLNKRKNFPHLLKSFIRFLDKSGRKDISLVIAGPKRPKYQELTETIKEFANFQDRIVVTGFVDDADLPALYSGAEVFVFPSLYEGFGLPILEAMACGTPVICANNSSLPEVAGDAAVYISGEDEGETSSILTTVCQDDKLKHQMAKNAHARAKMFSWDKSVDILIAAMAKEVN